MTFSGKIKKEISNLECTKLEYISELSGIIRTSADIKLYAIRIQTENINVANRIFKIVKEIYGKILIETKETEISLSLKEFNKQEEVIKNRLILYTTRQLMGSSQGIEKIHLKDIIKLCENNIGNKYLTPNKNIKILVKDKKIFFISQHV